MTSDKIYIIKKAQQGDRKAMRLMYEEYYQYVLDYSHRYLMNYTEAKDVTQDIFLRVFDKINSYKFESDFGAWLNLVCRNHIISYIRKEKKNKFEAFNEFTQYENHNDDDLEDTEIESYKKNLTIEEMYCLLEQLDSKSRMIFNLYAIDGLTHKQIGLQLGISDGTSKSQLSRARVKLKELLACEVENKNRQNRNNQQSHLTALLIFLFILIKEIIQ